MIYFVYILRAVTTILTVALVGISLGYGQITPGQKAPVFELADINGKRYDLATMESHPMIILYFLDVASRTSQEGLMALDDLSTRYADTGLKVWAITRSTKDEVTEFVSKGRIDFPFLLDSLSEASDLYNARFVVPTTCIIGPRLQILDYIQGGGKSTEIMLVKLAEKELQRNQVENAKVISEYVILRNTQNENAEMIKGYAELKDGDLDSAEKTFLNLSQKKGQGEVLGKEGLVSVYSQKGQANRALELAEELQKIAPDRGHAHAVKADILYTKGKKKEAQAEYQKAVQKKSAAFQKAASLNKLGQLQVDMGNLPKARELYVQAVAIDPYNISAATNMGQTYEKEGKWDKALEAYRKALAVNKDDVFVASLAKRAQGMLSMQNDVEKRKSIDRIANRLAERFRKQQRSTKKEEDIWTSQPMAIALVDIQEKGLLQERQGFASVLIMNLSELLNASGRIQVVERILIEKLLDELNLGSSDLADPETTMRLGNVLAAKIIGIGSLYYLPVGALVNLRLIDTETSAIPKVLLTQIDYDTSPDKIVNTLNREILKTIALKYPLKGYVEQADTEQIKVNIGWKRGVILGTQFEVLKEQEPIVYKGKILRTSPEKIAQIEVNQVEPNYSYARILVQKGPIQQTDKVKEKIPDFLRD